MFEQPVDDEVGSGPVVELHFTPQPDDYVRCLQAYYARDRRIWLGMGLAGLLFVLALSNLVAARQATIMGVALLVLPLLIIAFLWLGVPWSVGQRVQRDSRLRSPCTWHISDDRVVMCNQFGESRLEWMAFGRILQTGTHYLLISSTNRGMLFIVPRRAFVSPQQEESFREIVRRHLPGLPAS